MVMVVMVEVRQIVVAVVHGRRLDGRRAGPAVHVPNEKTDGVNSDCVLLYIIMVGYRRGTRGPGSYIVSYIVTYIVFYIVTREIPPMETTRRDTMFSSREILEKHDCFQRSCTSVFPNR